MGEFVSWARCAGCGVMFSFPPSRTVSVFIDLEAIFPLDLEFGMRWVGVTMPERGPREPVCLRCRARVPDQPGQA